MVECAEAKRGSVTKSTARLGELVKGKQGDFML